LNPFSNYSDPYTLQRGNPFLMPEIIHLTELSYLRFWKKFNLNTTIYHRFIKDLHRRNLINEGAYSTVEFTNLGSSHLTGADLILTYRPVKQVRITSSTSVYNTSTKDEEITGGEYQNYFGMNTNLMASLRLKTWSFQIQGDYSSRRYVLLGEIVPQYALGIGLRKQLMDGKLTIGVRATDLFKTRQFGFESYDLGNYFFNTYRNWESRTVFLSVSYNFGKMVQGKQKRRSVSGDASDDRNGGGF